VHRFVDPKASGVNQHQKHFVFGVGLAVQHFFDFRSGQDDGDFFVLLGTALLAGYGLFHDGSVEELEAADGEVHRRCGQLFLFFQMREIFLHVVCCNVLGRFAGEAAEGLVVVCVCDARFGAVLAGA